jgi:hypothetical protein
MKQERHKASAAMLKETLAGEDVSDFLFIYNQYLFYF